MLRLAFLGAILPRAPGAAAANREITDVQSIQRVRESCELEHRCRFGMGLRGVPCWSANRSAPSVATDAGSGGAERSAPSVATDAGSRGAGRSNPAAIRARFDA